MRYLWHRSGGDEPARALVSRTLFTPRIASWGRDYSLLNRSLCKFGILSRDLQQSTQRGIISNQAKTARLVFDKVALTDLTLPVGNVRLIGEDRKLAARCQTTRLTQGRRT